MIAVELDRIIFNHKKNHSCEPDLIAINIEDIIQLKRWGSRMGGVEVIREFNYSIPTIKYCGVEIKQAEYIPYRT